MPLVTVRFSLHFSPWVSDVGPDSTGIWAAAAQDVIELGQISNLPVTQNQGSAKLEVNAIEDDPRLIKIYNAIWEKYRLKPSPHQIVPVCDRQLYFGVRRDVTWTKTEINASEFLWLQNTLLIASDSCRRTSEQLACEKYVAELDHRQNSAVHFGSLMPFTGLAVAEPLRSLLSEEKLEGLHLPPLSFVAKHQKKIRKPLWALRSNIILPSARNLLLGEHGHPVKPNTEWWCWWDDGAKNPATLRYKRTEMQALGPLDIAMTNERVGQTEQGAYRQCIVSQRFREVFTRLKVKGVRYVPVEIT